MKNLTFKTGQYRWSYSLDREVLWTFYVYFDDKAYEFELEDGQVSCVTQFEGDLFELNEGEISYIFDEWKNY